MSRKNRAVKSLFFSKRILACFIIMIILVVAGSLLLNQVQHIKQAYQPIDGFLSEDIVNLDEEDSMKQAYNKSLFSLSDPAVEGIILGYAYPDAGRIGKRELACVSWYSWSPRKGQMLRLNFDSDTIIDHIIEGDQYQQQTIGDLFHQEGIQGLNHLFSSLTQHAVDFIAIVDFDQIEQQFKRSPDNLLTKQFLSDQTNQELKCCSFEKIVSLIFSWDNIPSLVENLTLLQGAVKTNLSFRQVLEIWLASLFKQEEMMSLDDTNQEGELDFEKLSEQLAVIYN